MPAGSGGSAPDPVTATDAATATGPGRAARGRGARVTSGGGTGRGLAGLGESGLLARVFPRLPAAPGTEVGPGDDAAVLAAPDARVVVTTDVLVEDRDFRRDWSSAPDVGWKAATANLADVAAMGARPTALVVALVAPPATEVDWVLGLTDGLAAACRQAGAGVVGGDLSGGPVVVVSVTALGDLGGRAPVCRDGARAGDVVAIAGTAGRSAAGLDLLRAGLGGHAPDLVAAHLRPDPPLAAGVLAAAAGATAMLDVSDGFVTDLGRIVAASGVSADLDPGWLAAASGPLRAAAATLGEGSGAGRGEPDPDARARAWVLSGGEEHALLACFPPGCLLPEPFTAIGSVRGRDEGPRVGCEGRDVTRFAGWDHFG